MKKEKKKINWKAIGNFMKPLVRETLQSLPVVGTLVTNFKGNMVEEDHDATSEKPPIKKSGHIALTKWDVYRLIIGGGVAYLLIKGLLTIQQISFILEFIGF